MRFMEFLLQHSTDANLTAMYARNLFQNPIFIDCCNQVLLLIHKTLPVSHKGTVSSGPLYVSWLIQRLKRKICYLSFLLEEIRTLLFPSFLNFYYISFIRSIRIVSADCCRLLQSCTVHYNTYIPVYLPVSSAFNHDSQFDWSW